ncbi:MAG: 2-amino-4-hydroxy-6-hydroxymethyldihydropteridine diphosphokinase [Paludibacteraceae bacterium]|nr:2-amino-4-hydroxy-6-hydroxymethyldihydropteridine diphosphokinase [Paludibacteraceae bacterium]
MSEIYVVSVSSNDHASENVRRAVYLLKEAFGKVNQSRVVETDPIGEGYPPCVFSNAAVCFRSSLDREAVRRLLKEIEHKLGRDEAKRRKHLVPVDLDVIVAGGRVVHEDYERLPFLKGLVAEVWDPGERK